MKHWVCPLAGSLRETQWKGTSAKSEEKQGGERKGGEASQAKYRKKDFTVFLCTQPASLGLLGAPNYLKHITE